MAGLLTAAEYYTSSSLIEAEIRDSVNSFLEYHGLEVLCSVGQGVKNGCGIHLKIVLN